LITWQLADQFNDAVHDLVMGSSASATDRPYRNQVLDAASGVPSNVAEGFLRYSPREFAKFLDYAMGLLVEAENRLRDGIRRRYFDADQCAPAFQLGRRCLTAAVRLKQSQRRVSRRKRR